MSSAKPDYFQTNLNLIDWLIDYKMIEWWFCILGDPWFWVLLVFKHFDS
jgi:hypothetical protein